MTAGTNPVGAYTETVSTGGGAMTTTAWFAQADASAEETLVVECDLAKIERTRRNWPFLRDRRIDAYQDLTRRFRN